MVATGSLGNVSWSHIIVSNLCKYSPYKDADSVIEKYAQKKSKHQLLK